jgi:hypothetical protein
MDLHDKKTTPAPLSRETQGAPQSPPPAEAPSALTLPAGASERAHVIAGLIGNPLAREGVPENVRFMLKASYAAGDAHGMFDSAMMAHAAADQHAKKSQGSGNQ